MAAEAQCLGIPGAGGGRLGPRGRGVRAHPHGKGGAGGVPVLWDARRAGGRCGGGRGDLRALREPLPRVRLHGYRGRPPRRPEPPRGTPGGRVLRGPAGGSGRDAARRGGARGLGQRHRGAGHSGGGGGGPVPAPGHGREGRRLTVDAAALQAFLEASVRLGAPLALAALGETISERAGVINIGLEGSIIGGALGGALGTLLTGSPGAGVLAGATAGTAIAGVFAMFAITLNADQIIVGTAVTLGGLGITGVVYQSVFGATGTALTLPTLPALPLPGLSALPALGPALFSQAWTTYLAYLLAPALWYYLFRTRWGLELRAVGEEPGAADAAGIRVRRTRVLAVLGAGFLAGIAGAHLALAHAGTFAEGMSAGRGFIAIAVVVLGRWNPLLVLLASLFFGAASALQFELQAVFANVPYQLLLAFPYLLTLAALAGWIGRSRAPAALARPWPPRSGE
ncbi:MAG: ABC transporter permease [Gammaproteobacteria bacterium]|nr:ABC transporter permease [Gammaproteobacteria bacterium]